MDTTDSEFVVALDIGSARTRCLIAELNGDDIRVVGQASETSRGVRRGEVVDLAAARSMTARAIRAAEQQADVEVQTLFLAQGSRHARFFNNRGGVVIARENQTVIARDVKRAVTAAHGGPMPDETQVIGSIVCSYTVDDVRHVRQPVGMHGTRLEAHLHVITDARTTAQNMAACVDQEKHDIEDTIFAPYAAGEAVLDDDEKKLGAAVIDIGAGTTGMMLYRDQSPVFLSVVPVGGDHITSDIAIGMNVGLTEAQRLKDEHAQAGTAPLQQGIVFERFPRGGTVSVDPRRLHCIVDARLREMLDIARREMLRAGVRSPSIRTVLTGGTARLPGIADLAEQILGCPVRIGKPTLGDLTMGPEMATAAGMLKVGREARKNEIEPEANGSVAHRLLNWLQQLF